MSKTTEIKRRILIELQDGKVHSTADIKKKIRDDYKGEITEGIFANAFKTMTIAGKIENLERGKYRIPLKTENLPNEEKIDGINKSAELKEAFKTYSLNYIKQIENILKNIDMGEDDDNTVQFGIELRKYLFDIKNELNNM